MYAQKRIAVETEWGETIRKFWNENYTTSRELENVSEWALAAELRHRGYGGTLTNADKPDDFMETLNHKLNGDGNTSED